MPEILLDIQHLTQQFPLGRHDSLRALDDLSLRLYRGEILGLVGESGSGKSTLARCVMRILRPSAGVIRYRGIDIWNDAEYKKHKRLLQAKRQLIFQDSAACLNPRMRVQELIAEPMQIHHIRPPRGSMAAEAAFQLQHVGMDARYLTHYPDTLSGGQRQRVAIARALTMEPELLVADEPFAALDVSIQAQILNLFRHLQAEHGFSILFISHDLSVVEYLCDRVGVLYRGRLVELAPTAELFQNPQHPYTQALLAAIPVPDPKIERSRACPNFDALSFPLDGDFVEVSPEHFVFTQEALC